MEIILNDQANRFYQSIFVLIGKKSKTVKKLVVALPWKNSLNVPSHQERAIFNANGLGERSVLFPAHGSATEMKESLMRYVKHT